MSELFYKMQAEVVEAKKAPKKLDTLPTKMPIAPEREECYLVMARYWYGDRWGEFTIPSMIRDQLPTLSEESASNIADKLSIRWTQISIVKIPGPKPPTTDELVKVVNEDYESIAPE